MVEFTHRILQQNIMFTWGHCSHNKWIKKLLLTRMQYNMRCWPGSWRTGVFFFIVPNRNIWILMSHNNLGVRGLTRYKSNMLCFCFFNSSNCFMANNYCEFCSLTLQNLLALYPVFLDEAQMGHDTPVHPEIREIGIRCSFYRTMGTFSKLK